ncbi:MAG: MFS transporter [Anaerolineaceae bacterium]|nr:MFS transporter [Anaerolineaceae bacterium]
MVEKRQLSPAVLLGISFFSFIAIGMPGGILNIAWTYMQDTFHVSLESLGVLLSAGTFGYLISAFTSGRLSAAIGLGYFLVLGASCEVIGILVIMTVPSWEMLLMGAMVMSFGGGMIDAGMNTFVSSRYSAGPLNWLHAFFGIGLTFGPPLVTFIVVAQGQSWRLSYLALLAVHGTLALIFLLTRNQWEADPQTDVTDEPTPRRLPAASIRETLKIPAVLLSMALLFTYAGLEVGGGQLTNTLFIDSRGISQETASFWISFYWASFTIGRMIMGSIAGRFQNSTLMRLSMSGTVVGALLLTVNLSNELGFLGLAILGFAQAPMFAIVIAETPRRAGPRFAANAIGFQIGFAGMGGALLPGLAGLLTVPLGLESIGPFLLALAVIMFVLHEALLRREVRAVALA